MPDVFISYSRRDSEAFVERLARDLEGSGIDVWVDLDDIPAASDWERDLREGVLGSESFCFVLSPGSVGSEHCRNELREAEARNKRLISIIHRAVAEDAVPATLRRINWIPQRGTFEDDFDRSFELLTTAIRTDLEALREHTRWEQRAATWSARERDPSLLARGTDMREAEDWLANAAGRDPAPTALQVEYVNASRRASARRQRIVLGASLGALAVAVVLGILALVQRNEARDQRDLARANELASAALANFEIDPERSLILAARAADLRHTGQTEQALAQSLAASRVRVTVEPDLGELATAELSDDGRWLVVGGEGGAAVFDANTGERTHFLGETEVADVEIDPNARQVATAGRDGFVRSFVLADGAGNGKIRVGGTPTSLSTSADGLLLATGNTEGAVRVFDYETGRTNGFLAHDGEVTDVEFGPATAVLTSGADEAARLWDAGNGELLASVDEKGLVGVDADISPDGLTFAAVGGDGIASLFNAATGERIGAPLSDLAREGRVVSVAFDSTGRQLLLGRDDGSSQMVGVDARTVLGTFAGHMGEVHGEFGFRDDSLVTVAADETARIWDVTAFERAWSESRDAVIADIELAGEVAVAAAGLSDGVVAVRDLESGDQVASFAAASDKVQGLDLSGEAELLTVAGSDGISLWRLGGGKPERLFKRPGAYLSASFAPGDDSILAIDARQDLVILSAEGEELLRRSAGAAYFVPSFSPDGSRIITGGDGVTIVDAESGEDVGTVEPSEFVLAAAFDPSGERIVTAGANGAIELWDIDSEERIDVLDNSTRVLDVAYTPDGERLVTNSLEGIRLWSLDSGLVLKTLPLNAGQAELTFDARSLAVAGLESGQLELWECENCASGFDAMRTLAEDRVTREPTEQETDTFGLDE